MDQGLVVLAVLAAAEILPRLVVRRSQPFESAELLAADDALRSWSAHSVVGALLATMLLLLSGQLWSLGSGTGIKVLSWVFLPLAFVLTPLAVACVQSLSGYDWRWRVERPERQPS